ncbi:meiosis regulator and mRNA stability factor 1-like [Antedon mediterranea]|uniref:meiosis regulator and mRNA stability factor 1-like n=1 Tax=Antedon mediterranea TaxID=105859 RepID=UPI003AF52028
MSINDMSNYYGNHLHNSSIRCNPSTEECHHHSLAPRSGSLPRRERTGHSSQRRGCFRHHDRYLSCDMDTVDHAEDDYQGFASCDTSSEDDRQLYFQPDRRSHLYTQKKSGRHNTFKRTDNFVSPNHDLERTASQLSVAYSAPSHRPSSSTCGICSCCSEASAFQQCNRGNETCGYFDTSTSRPQPPEYSGTHGRHMPCSGCHHSSPKHVFNLTTQLKALLQPESSHEAAHTSSHQLMMAALQDSHTTCCMQQQHSCVSDHQQCCTHRYHQQSQTHCIDCATNHSGNSVHNKYSVPQYQDPSILATSGFHPLPHRPSCSNPQTFPPQTPLRMCDNLPQGASSPPCMRSSTNHSLGHNITSEITALFDQSFQHTSTPDVGASVTTCRTQHSVHHTSPSTYCHCLKCSGGASSSPRCGHSGQVQPPSVVPLGLEGKCNPLQNTTTDENGINESTPTVDKPPIGVFWDIENCSVPRGRSALVLVQRIRDQFFGGHREAEFMCVCDINKENNSVIQELNDAQVTVAHINATAKNAADDKLKQSLRRFADTHTQPATVVLISGDVNFANDLSDLRHRHGLKIILIHRPDSSDALTTCANETILFNDLLVDLPFRSPLKECSEYHQLVVRNLPPLSDISKVRNRLKQLSDNCGGKVVFINDNLAILKFQNAENAARGKKRLDGEDVFGSKVSVTMNAKPYKGSPMRSSGNSSNNSFRSNKASPKIQNREDENDGKREDTETETDNPIRGKAIHPKVQRVVDGVWFPPQQMATISTPEFSRSSTSSARYTQLSATFSPIINPANTAMDLSNREVGKDYLHNCQSSYVEHATHTTTHHPTYNAAYQPTYTSANHPATSTQSGFQNILPIILNPREPQKPVELHFPCNLPNETAATGVSEDIISHREEVSPTSSNIPVVTGSSCTERTDQMIGTYVAPSSKMESLMSYDRQGVEDLTSGAEVLVTNLDPMLSKKELRRQLITAFTDNCIRMENLSLQAPSQGHIQAIVEVNRVCDGQLALAKIGGRKIGMRRVQLAVLPRSKSGADHLRLMVTPMLQEMPGKCLPFYKFKEVFESRYNQQLFEEDLYHISDTVLVKENGSTKLVCLTMQHHRSTPSSFMTSSSNGYRQSPWNVPYEPPKELAIPPCEPFCNQHDDIGIVVKNYQMRAAEIDQNVAVSLRIFSAQVETLLQLHHGRIPLISFTRCYAAEFEKLEENPEGGVPLEHLLMCIPGVRVALNTNGVKIVCFSGKGKIILGDDLGRSSSPILPTLLFQFSKEATEVLKHSSYCRLELNLFLQAYNHHFGKQCHLIDYGYTKLSDIFSTIPHIIQLLGAGDKQILTLTHQVQIKRFAQDVTKVLRSQASKQVTLEDLPAAFQRCLSRPFNIVEYGVCEVQDIIVDIPNTVIMVDGVGDDITLSIPHRDQTPEEIVRTQRFGREVVDLMSHKPNFSMPFQQFIPDYHHHFGRQCKVADYGVNKLLELFEAIPEIVQVEITGNDRQLTLTLVERLSILAIIVINLLRHCHFKSMALCQLLQLYRREQGHHLQPIDYQCKTVEQVFQKMPHVVEVADLVVNSGQINTRETERSIVLVNRKHLSQLAQWILVLLIDQPGGRLEVKYVPDVFQQRYHMKLRHVEYGYSQLVLLLSDIPHVIKIYNKWLPESYIELTQGYQFARKARLILLKNQNCIALQDFATLYEMYFKEPFIPHVYEKETVLALVSAVPRVLTLIGRGQRRAVVLNADLKVVRSITPSSSEDPGVSSSPNPDSDVSVPTPSTSFGQESGFASSSGTGSYPAGNASDDQIHNTSVKIAPETSDKSSAHSGESLDAITRLENQPSGQRCQTLEQTSSYGRLSHLTSSIERASRHDLVSSSNNNVDLIDLSSPSAKRVLSSNNNENLITKTRSLPSSPCRLRTKCKIAANFSLAYM